MLAAALFFKGGSADIKLLFPSATLVKFSRLWCSPAGNIGV